MCLYEQIYNHIKKEIMDGKLLAGERLPSTRSLADFLQVARSTVDLAYGQLQDEGYIEAKPYRGFFVCELGSMVGLGTQEPENAVSALSSQSKVEAEEGLSDLNPVMKSGEEAYLYDFSPYDIDMEGFPFDTWRRITKKILSDANSELFSRGEPQGDLELRRTISRYLHSSRGVVCSPEQIIVGAGNDYLLLLLEKILGPGRSVAMENPTYLRSYRIFKSFDYTVLPMEMDESGMCSDALKNSSADVAYVMPSHQFPTGLVMPVRRRSELLGWAAQAPDRYLIEDDYDSEFRFRGKPIPALQSMDEHDKVIYLGSFSKAIAPAIRVSFMVLPMPLLEKFRKDCYFYSCTVSRIDQSILNEFIQNGHFERHLNKMRKIYRQKHDLLLELLEGSEQYFKVLGENAGLHLLIQSNVFTEAQLVERAAAAGIKVYGLSLYTEEHAPRDGYVLLGFGGLSLEKIRQGARILREVWK